MPAPSLVLAVQAHLDNAAVHRRARELLCNNIDDRTATLIACRYRVPTSLSKHHIYRSARHSLALVLPLVLPTLTLSLIDTHPPCPTCSLPH
jgi:hypothetical protein